MLDDAMAPGAGAAARLDAAGGNRLLASLPAEDLETLSRQLRAERLAPGHILFEADDTPAEVVFPADGTALSLLSASAGRRPVETTTIGCEGMVGAIHGPSSGPAPGRCVVLAGGIVLRLPADAFARAVEASPALRGQVARYAAALIAQLQQGVACAALHPVEARASRWMLALQDRLGDASLPITQEALADLLGVRRTTVTRVVATLETRGLIRHRRGRLVVLDRAGLEAAACDCHRRVRGLFERIGPRPRPPAGAGPVRAGEAPGGDRERGLRNRT